MKLFWFVFVSLMHFKDSKQELKNYVLKNFQRLHSRRLFNDTDTDVETMERDKEIQCIRACLKKKDCVSLNSKQQSANNKFLCELLSISKYSNNEDLIKDDNYVHWYLKDPCLPNPCSNGETCLENHDEPLGVTCHCPPGPEVDPNNRCEYNSSYNFALGKPTAQSSTIAPASRAVDGNRETNFQLKSCAHTDLEPTMWWRVDLEHEIPVARVTITNRGDCCGERLSDFEIKIGNSLADDGKENPKCGNRHGIGQGLTETIRCLPPIRGRYLLVQSFYADSLVLCEVEVYAGL